MATRKMTQAEAISWRTRAKIAEMKLNQQRNAWAKEWPDGTDIGRAMLDAELSSAIRTARKLKHAVIAHEINKGEVFFVACALPEAPHE
jgi:hypothetical protein